MASKPTVYVVHAIRCTGIEGAYIVGVYRKKDRANKVAEKENTDRGGKYRVEVCKFTPE